MELLFDDLRHDGDDADVYPIDWWEETADPSFGAEEQPGPFPGASSGRQERPHPERSPEPVPCEATARPPRIQWDDLQVRLRVHEKMCARLGWVLADPASSFQHKAAQTQHLLSSSRRLFIELRKLKRRDDATLQAQCLGR